MVVYLAMPASKEKIFQKSNLKKIDWIGGFLSVAWPIPFLFALQEGGSDYAWGSGIIIGTLVGGIVGLIVFMAYETWLQHRGKQEPTFPVRYVEDPVIGLLILFVRSTLFFSELTALTFYQERTLHGVFDVLYYN